MRSWLFVCLFLAITANWALSQPNTSPATTHSTTGKPTHGPTDTPTHKPTDTPTHKPTDTPTHRPTNTPTHGPTKPTTPAPPPVVPNFPSSAGKWFFNDTKINGTKTVCVIVSFAAQFKLTYNTTDNKTASAYINLPSDEFTGQTDNSSSSCSVNETLVVDFGENVLTVRFSKTNDKVDVQQLQLRVKINGTVFHGIEPQLVGTETTVNVKQSDLNNYEVSSNTYYKCLSKGTSDLEVEAPLSSGQLQIAQVSLEAYRDNTNEKFSKTVKQCIQDTEVNDVVPIAVGCALAGLVVIVLIAYFIGRRRSRRLAYQSV